LFGYLVEEPSHPDDFLLVDTNLFGEADLLELEQPLRCGKQYLVVRHDILLPLHLLKELGSAGQFHQRLHLFYGTSL
jgi:hypothetical protein